MMKMIRYLLKLKALLLLSVCLLTSCANNRICSDCHAGYINAFNECSVFVANISDYSTKDKKNAECLENLGYPKGSNTCDIRCR